MQYRVAEVMAFTSCNYRCGYCGYATGGGIFNVHDMAPYKDKAYIDRIFEFFHGHSDAGHKWILHLSGGEPFLMPNSGYFSEKFISAGHKLAFNTNLSLPIESNGWMDSNPPEGIDCIIASLHQESLDRFDEIYKRVGKLKKAGYPVCMRMVAHPQFMGKFDDLHEKFRDIDVSFSVNALFSPVIPRLTRRKKSGQ